MHQMKGVILGDRLSTLDAASTPAASTRNPALTYHNHSTKYFNVGQILTSK